MKQAVNTLDEEAVPPAPDCRLRHAGGPHRLRQGEAVAEVQDDCRPLDMLEDRIRIGLDHFETFSVFLAQNDPGSPALCHCGSAPIENCAALAGSVRIMPHWKIESPKTIITLGRCSTCTASSPTAHKNGSFLPSRAKSQSFLQGSMAARSGGRAISHRASASEKSVRYGSISGKSRYICPRASTISAAFSAIIVTGAWVFPDGIAGMTEASATERPPMP